MSAPRPEVAEDRRGAVVAACSLTDEDRAVVRIAGQAARAFGVELRLVHLLTPADGFAGGGPASSAARARDREAAAARLDAMAAEASGRLQGPAVRASVVEGVPHRGIALLAEEVSAGLIVLGAQAHADRSTSRLGATAERVVRHGVAPTLLVRGEPPVPFRRVLGPVDFSPLSIAALEEGLDLLAPLADSATAGRLFFAVSPFQGAVGEQVVDYDDAMEISAGELESLAARLDGRFPGTLGSRVERGFPRELVVAEATSFKADVVALGSHGRGGFERMLLGSVAEHVLRTAPCSVLVIPARDPGSPGPDDG